jgi:hypothetical protein
MLPDLSIHDADFRWRLRWRWSRLEGRLSQRWVPYGMPRLRKRFPEAVFFLHGKNPKTGKLGPPCGTGVFVNFIDDTGLLCGCYAVTAAHVAKGGYPIIRLNTKDGKSRPLELDADVDWVSAAWDDIAVADVTERFSELDKVSAIPSIDLLKQVWIEHYDIGVGEDGFMLGLFTSQAGENRNMIAARFGNVSLLAAEDEPIRHKAEGFQSFTTPCHVFDLHSRPGFSGSPVFVYRTPDADIRDLDSVQAKSVYVTDRGTGHRNTRSMYIVPDDDGQNSFLRMLGIHVGQFHEKLRLKKVTPTSVEVDDTALQSGDAVRFPGSMTIVVPAWQVLKLIEENETLRNLRHARWSQAEAQEDAKEGVAVAESAEDSTEPGDANPNHKEDFMRLLGAAATTKPSKGQT